MFHLLVVVGRYLLGVFIYLFTYYDESLRLGNLILVIA